MRLAAAGMKRSRLAEGCMNKADLIDAVSRRAALSKADAGRAVDAVIDSITAWLKKGERVALSGFGTFGVRRRVAKRTRNPRTGAVIQIKAGRTPGFKSGKALKDAVN
jgi:DNA-binding protein HU-beta